ncbi:hypothetical protein Tco_1264108 [Tanacetum coccineum]
MCHKTTLASDTSSDFQIDFSISIGETVTHWFTLIVLSALRRSGRSLRIRRILKDGGEGYNNNTGAFQMLRTVNPLSVVYGSPSLSMLVGPWYVSVFTLSSRTWYKLESYCLPRESIRIKRSGQAVVGGKIFWVINLPEQMLVGEFLPPYYISQLEDSIIISGSFNFGDVCFIDAWELEVDDGEVSSYRLLFTIPYPAQHELKLIGFTKDKEPIVEASPALEKIVWGFGVRPDTLDPTILNISSWLYGDGPLHVLMYTLSSDTWTVLGNDRLPRLDIPTQLRNSLPIPFYISNLGNSLVISGNLIHYENRYICAWLLEVKAAVVTSWRVLFVIPSQNIAKLLGFTMDDDPIVEVFSGQEMVHTLQVYDRPSQQFPNVGIEGDGGSFFIGPYKESLILLNV